MRARHFSLPVLTCVLQGRDKTRGVQDEHCRGGLAALIEKRVK
jgi:hypothetical protein